MTTQPQSRWSAPWSVALGLIVVAFTIQAGYQTLFLMDGHRALQRIATSQIVPFKQSIQTRKQLQLLAGGIAKLAKAGNPDAIVVRQAMLKRGVRLH
jgi:hypothetical protein